MVTGLLHRARRFRAAYRALSGWRLFLLLFFLGGFSVLGHAPFFAWPAYAVGLSALVLALDDAKSRQRPLRSGFIRGFWFASGAFLAGTGWVANAFLVSAEDYAWLIWAPLIVLPAGLALFWGAAGALYVRFAPRHAGRIGVFTVIVMALEFLRSTILSGFPWNLPGHVFEAGGAISQTASLIGAYGLSVLALFVFSAPAALSGRGPRLARGIPLVMGVCLLLASWGYGITRLSGADDIARTDNQVLLVSLNLPQTEKRYAARHDILEQYLALSRTGDLSRVEAVIWPEGAIPAMLLDSPDLLAELSDGLPPGTRLITGTARAEYGLGGRPRAYFNSLVSISLEENGAVLEAQYDKSRLVPFGESNPLRLLTEWIGFDSLSELAPYYSPGAGARTLNLEGLPGLAPLICYEAVYPRYSPRQSNRPDWLLNISNDSWYGNSSGPQQLLNQTQYRAIEEGLPLVRVAAAGVSGQIDPYGRLIESIPSKSTEVLMITLLEGLHETPYGKYGNALWVIVLLVLAAVAHFLSVVATTHLGRALQPTEGR
ncbi:apolipoprotein N-acyltransferase [Oceanicaulis sp. HTCC2633]|uniref:apolipoprotein N-acyltransferase n=1 Tax=Oceanicaulis sp. HTCC2633 TaxID=314254 RepID=UPI00006697DC|nr:apolipoprotein N-acyltransferase [Oceanicaulis sp. HTCC2633]EAP89636.1 apolipoprotein N-acyltransferase [Oceanicaulis sp. HTCC2633]